MLQRRKYGAALLLGVTLMLAGSLPTVAQTADGGATPPTAEATGAAAPTATEEKPDVIALTFPLPTGQHIISMVYSSKVERAKVESRAKRFLAMNNWTGSSFEYEDKAIDGVAAQWEGGKAPVMSSVTFITNGAPVNPTDGSILLEPYLLALRELNRVHLTFATPPNFVYHGPKQFKNDAVEISCSAGQGSVTCAAKINNHTAEKLDLPLLVAEETEATKGANAKDAAPRVPIVTVVFALLAAMTAGIGVFLLARRIVTR